MGGEGAQPRHERKNFPPQKSERGPPRNLPPLAKREARLGAEPHEQGQGEAEPGGIGNKRRRKRARDGRRKRARQRLEGESDALVFSSDDAPTQLPLIDVAEGSRAGFLGDRAMRKYGLETLPREHYRNRGIFGKRIAYGGDAAHLGEVASPEKHCLADPKAEAQRRGGQQEPGMAIYRNGLDPAGEISRTHRDRHPDDKPDSLRKILHESRHRAGVERDIRILGEDEIMASGGERRRGIIEFWADRRRARRAQKTARNLGMEGRDAPRRVERRRLLFGGADQDLVGGIVLDKHRGLRGRETGV